MKSTPLIASILCTLSLVGCRDPGPGLAASIDDRAKYSDNIEAGSRFSTGLPWGDHSLPFAYHISVDRAVKNKYGNAAREILIELLEVDPIAADSVLSAVIAARGGVIVSRTQKGRKIRTQYRLIDGSQMLVWVRSGAPKGEQYALRIPGSKGTIYIAWPYVEKP